MSLLPPGPDCRSGRPHNTASLNDGLNKSANFCPSPLNPPSIGTSEGMVRTTGVVAQGELAPSDRSGQEDAGPDAVSDSELAAWAMAEARRRAPSSASELAAAYDRDVRADDIAETARAERAWAFGRGV
jgi:hypothetical protein